MREILPERPTNDIPEKPDGNWPSIDGIDHELVKPMMGYCPVLFANLLKIMRKNYIGWTEEWVVRAKNEADFINRELCQSLHKLRGGASMVGATVVAEKAGLAEVALTGHRQDPLSAIQSVASELTDLLNSIGEWELRRDRITEPLAERDTLQKVGQRQPVGVPAGPLECQGAREAKQSLTVLDILCLQGKKYAVN